eukprot:40677_1
MSPLHVLLFLYTHIPSMPSQSIPHTTLSTFTLANNGGTTTFPTRLMLYVIIALLSAAIFFVICGTITYCYIDWKKQRDKVNNSLMNLQSSPIDPDAIPQHQPQSLFFESPNLRSYHSKKYTSPEPIIPNKHTQKQTNDIPNDTITKEIAIQIESHNTSVPQTIEEQVQSKECSEETHQSATTTAVIIDCNDEHISISQQNDVEEDVNDDNNDINQEESDHSSSDSSYMTTEKVTHPVDVTMSLGGLIRDDLKHVKYNETMEIVFGNVEDIHEDLEEGHDVTSQFED